MGCILVAHDGNGGLRSRKRRHGVGVKKGVNSTCTSGGGHISYCTKTQGQLPGCHQPQNTKTRKHRASQPRSKHKDTKTRKHENTLRGTTSDSSRPRKNLNRAERNGAHKFWHTKTLKWAVKTLKTLKARLFRGGLKRLKAPGPPETLPPPSVPCAHV